MVGQAALVVGEGLALRGLLSELALKLANVRILVADLLGEIVALGLKGACALPRQFEILAQPLVLGFEQGGLLLDGVELRAQCVGGSAGLLKLAIKAQVLGLFLLQRPQGIVEGVDDLLEGDLELVELIDLAARIEQQVAERLVLLADAGTHVGGRFRLDFALNVFQSALVAIAIGAPMAAGPAFTAKKVGQLTHKPTLPNATRARSP